MKTDIHLHLTWKQMPANDMGTISSAENMLSHLKEMDISKGIVMSSGEGNNPLMPICDNRECRTIAEQFSGIYYWMCNVDPVEPATVYERLAQCKARGAVGIGEFMVNQRIDSPFIQSVFSAAEKLSLPILFHMSPQEGYQYGIVDEPGLPLLEESLKKYPNLVFIGHSQPFWHEITKNPGDTLEERMAWGTGDIIPGGRVPYLFEHYPNLHGDLSANSGGCAIMRDEDFGLAFLKKYNRRLMFGTDMANTDMTFPLGAWLDEKYKKGKLDRETYENICFRNADRLLNLDKAF